ncbi:MAG: right-handed parallel beta-helix repeat-containing protein [Desulfuromonadales bacterium]
MILLINKSSTNIIFLYVFYVIYLIAFLSHPVCAEANEYDLKLYVATNGDDNWSGRMDTPLASGNDGPFATLQRAQLEITKIKTKTGLPHGSIVIEILRGTYFIQNTLELSEVDSGTQESPVVYRARKGEKVILSGGSVISNWNKITDKEALKKLSAAASENVLQANIKGIGHAGYGKPSGGGLELFFADRPMTLARWPNEGFVKIEDVVKEQPFDIRGEKGYRVGKLKYSGDRPQKWQAENDLWAHGYWFWDWAEERQRVRSIDLVGHTITLATPYHEYGYRRGQWYYIYNALSELDSPGEWYLDRDAGIIFFWPPASITENTSVVSLTDSLVRFTGVSHVSFEDMTLEATRGTAISVKGSTDVTFSSLVIRNTGGWGVMIEGGKNCQVVNSSIFQTGEGGISIKGGDRATLDPAFHKVENNSIYSFARWKRISRPGVEVSGVGNRIAHNHIYDAPHQAIFISGNNHVIEYNELNDVCKESNDAGAIYAGRDWTMRGNVVQHNYLHDIRGRAGEGAIGVYLDDMFSGTDVIGNVFSNVATAVLIGGGRDNMVSDNVCTGCGICVHIDSRGLDWAAPAVKTVMLQRLKMMPYRSELWKSEYPGLFSILDNKPGAAKGNKIMNNLSWKGRFAEVDSLAEAETVFISNILNLDPEFVDMNDITAGVRKASPLYKYRLWPPKESIGKFSK